VTETILRLYNTYQKMSVC